MDCTDTIVAISTPLGEGGIGIVRISGKEALKIANGVLKVRKGELVENVCSGRIRLAHAIEPNTGEAIDEVLVSIMRAPHTYTREDVVEINCHGGMVAVRTVLEAAVDAGARIAEPGEFTKRAFLNGRIDLAQAEAVADVIRSKTREGLKIALGQLRGQVSEQIAAIRKSVFEILVEIEAAIDFADEDLQMMPVEQLLGKTVEARDKLEKLIRSAGTGRIYKEGMRVAIVGRPNVGKSSLLNALVRDSRAIVTPVPGTTRDVVEEYVNLSGVPYRLRDTAGIREPGDEVEEIGVNLSRREIEEAHIVLLVLDASEALAREDVKIAAAAQTDKTVLVMNKVDLPQKLTREALEKEMGGTVVRISALTGEGLEELEKGMLEFALSGRVGLDGGAIITDVRHKKALEKAREDMLEAEACMRKGVSEEFVATLLHDAVGGLGEILGEKVEGDLLEEIFSKFCIGK
jgi:tRNA modification GTPase